MVRRRIEDEIRKNRETAVRLEGQDYAVAATRRRSLEAPAGAVEITTTATIYRRDLGDGLVVNHPGPEHGVNQGVLGDRRTDWTQIQTLDAGDGVFTANGRLALAEALDGTGTALDTLATGTDGTDPSTTDTSLGSAVEAVDAWITQPDDQTLRAAAVFEWHELESTVAEIGADATDDTLLTRLVPEEIPLASDEEVKVELDLEFAHSGSSSAITDWSSIAHALDGGTSIDLVELALGTDGTDPTEGDTALGTEIASPEAAVATGANGVSLVAVLLEDEPDTSTYDLQEAGAIADDGTLVWRVTYAAMTKDDERPLQARSLLRFQS